MHLGDRARARRPAGAAVQPDHGDMTTANAESGQIRPANKPGRGRLQRTAFVVTMGTAPDRKARGRRQTPVARRALVVTHSKGTWCREAPGSAKGHRQARGPSPWTALFRASNLGVRKQVRVGSCTGSVLFAGQHGTPQAPSPEQAPACGPQKAPPGPSPRPPRPPPSHPAHNPNGNRRGFACAGLCCHLALRGPARAGGAWVGGWEGAQAARRGGRAWWVGGGKVRGRAWVGG
jgi:hypothetical protein